MPLTDPELGTLLARPPAYRLPAEYSWLRANDPVPQAADPFWGQVRIITRYRDAVTVLTDPRFRRTPQSPATAHCAQALPRLLSSLDPPDHTRLRALAASAFSMRQARVRAPAIAETAARLIGKIDWSAGPADLYTRLCLPLSVQVTSELTGFPADLCDQAATWSHDLLDSQQPARGTDPFARQGAFVAEAIAAIRARPGSNVLSDLVRLCDRDHVLTEADLTAMVASLPVTGHVKAAAQLTAALLILLDRPRERRMLLTSAGNIPAAVEEILRFAPVPHHPLPRFAATSTELSGQPINPGDIVIPALHSANHDETAFTEPSQLIWNRNPNPHLTFGHGTHFCLGAPLVRIMLRVTVTVALSQLPGDRCAISYNDLRWLTGPIAHGLIRLPVHAPSRPASAH